MAYPFVAEYIARVVVGGCKFTDVESDVFRASLSLRDHAGLVHMYRYPLPADQQVLIGASRYLFHNIDPTGTPCGSRLPVQCRSCGRIYGWRLIFEREGAYVRGVYCHVLVYECSGLRPICRQQVMVCRDDVANTHWFLQLDNGRWARNYFFPGYSSTVFSTDKPVGIDV